MRLGPGAAWRPAPLEVSALPADRRQNAPPGRSSGAAWGRRALGLLGRGCPYFEGRKGRFVRGITPLGKGWDVRRMLGPSGDSTRGKGVPG